MNDGKEKRHVFDNPRNVRWVIRAVYVLCALTIVAQFFIEVEPEDPLEAVFGFNGVYGFAAFVVLVLLAKEVLRRAVMRKEDYYDE